MLEIRFPLKSAKEPPPLWVATIPQLTDWQKDFRHLDIEAECRHARQWCIANPGKRKTAKGMPRFLLGWFLRAEGSGGIERRVQVCPRCGSRPKCRSYAECTPKMLARSKG